MTNKSQPIVKRLRKSKYTQLERLYLHFDDDAVDEAVLKGYIKIENIELSAFENTRSSIPLQKDIYGLSRHVRLAVLTRKGWCNSFVDTSGIMAHVVRDTHQIMLKVVSGVAASLIVYIIISTLLT